WSRASGRWPRPSMPPSWRYLARGSGGRRGMGAGRSRRGALPGERTKYRQRRRRDRIPVPPQGASTSLPPGDGGGARAVRGSPRPGAACLDLAWTACGVFDGFFELSLAPWDLAAGALLVQEAGGIVTDRRAERTSWPATSWPVPKPCTASFSRWPARYVERAAP